ELARCHGLYVVAHSLRLDYSTLKKTHVNGSAECSVRRRRKRQPTFIELIGAAGERMDEYVIEFRIRPRRQAVDPLRIHCKTATRRTGRHCCTAWRRVER